MSEWRVLSSYGAILTYVAAHPQATGLEISAAIGVQERTVRRNIAVLLADGYLRKDRAGRTNRYEVNMEMPLRRPGMRGATVGDLVKALAPFVGEGQ